MRSDGVSIADEDPMFIEIIRNERGMPFEVLVKLKKAIELKRNKQAIMSTRFMSVFWCLTLLMVCPWLIIMDSNYKQDVENTILAQFGVSCFTMCVGFVLLYNSVVVEKSIFKEAYVIVGFILFGLHLSDHGLDKISS